MSFRKCSMTTLALALFVAATALALAAEPLTHDGKLISITGEKLVMTGKDGKEHSHSLATDARLILDGKSCQAADLKAGTRIRVTTQADGNSVSRIEGLDKNPDFASNRQDGKVVSVAGDRLVVTLTQGSESQTYMLAPTVNVTCDGVVCKSADLKPGMKVRVTLESVLPFTATRVEAIEKNLDFASL